MNTMIPFIDRATVDQLIAPAQAVAALRNDLQDFNGLAIPKPQLTAGGAPPASSSQPAVE